MVNHDNLFTTRRFALGIEFRSDHVPQYSVRLPEVVHLPKTGDAVPISRPVTAVLVGAIRHARPSAGWL